MEYDMSVSDRTLLMARDSIAPSTEIATADFSQSTTWPSFLEDLTGVLVDTGLGGPKNVSDGRIARGPRMSAAARAAFPLEWWRAVEAQEFSHLAVFAIFPHVAREYNLNDLDILKETKVAVKDMIEREQLSIQWYGGVDGDIFEDKTPAFPNTFELSLEYDEEIPATADPLDVEALASARAALEAAIATKPAPLMETPKYSMDKSRTPGGASSGGGGLTTPKAGTVAEEEDVTLGTKAAAAAAELKAKEEEAADVKAKAATADHRSRSAEWFASVTRARAVVHDSVAKAERSRARRASEGTPAVGSRGLKTPLTVKRHDVKAKKPDPVTPRNVTDAAALNKSRQELEGLLYAQAKLLPRTHAKVFPGRTGDVADVPDMAIGDFVYRIKSNNSALAALAKSAGESSTGIALRKNVLDSTLLSTVDDMKFDLSPADRLFGFLPTMDIALGFAFKSFVPKKKTTNNLRLRSLCETISFVNPVTRKLDIVEPALRLQGALADAGYRKSDNDWHLGWSSSCGGRSPRPPSSSWS
jgi:hypothetical protein